MSDDVMNIAKENGFLKDTIETLTDSYVGKFEYNVDEGGWCYMRGDSSGRDFYDLIPVRYMTEDEWEHISDEVAEWSEDYDWKGLEEDIVIEFIYDEFPDIFEQQLSNK